MVAGEYLVSGLIYNYSIIEHIFYFRKVFLKMQYVCSEFSISL